MTSSASKYRLVGLWCLRALSTIFQLYRGGQIYWWKKPEYPAKTTDCHKSLFKYMIGSEFSGSKYQSVGKCKICNINGSSCSFSLLRQFLYNY